MFSAVLSFKRRGLKYLYGNFQKHICALLLRYVMYTVHHILYSLIKRNLAPMEMRKLSILFWKYKIVFYFEFSKYFWSILIVISEILFENIFLNIVLHTMKPHFKPEGWPLANWGGYTLQNFFERCSLKICMLVH